MLAHRLTTRFACSVLLAGALALFAAPVRAQSAAPPAPTIAAPPAPAAAGASPQRNPADDQAPASADAGAVVAVDLAARPALTLSGSAQWDTGLQTVMGALDTLRGEMGRVGLQPGGKPIAVFTETDDQGFKFTAMTPLAVRPDPPLSLGQGVTLAETPAGKAMKFEHRGSYDDIDTSYEAITAYLDEKGLEAKNLFLEEYLTLPKGTDDTDLEVDIYVFLK